MARGVIFRLGRTVQMEERLNRRKWAELSPCQKSVGFTIDTNAEPHKLSTSGDLGPEFSWHGATRRGDVNRPSSGTFVS